MMANRCPDTDTLADFANGRLAALQRAKIDLHLAECATCRQRVAAGSGSGGVDTAAGSDAEPKRSRPTTANEPALAVFPGPPTPQSEEMADSHRVPAGAAVTSRKGKALRLVLVSVAVLLGLSSAALFVGFRKGADHYEAIARTAFQVGDYTQVEETCRRLQSRDPQRTLGHLLQGNLLFFKGDLADAAAAYQLAIDAEVGRPRDKADALMGLGRIASEQGQAQMALQWYRQAADMAPELTQPLLAQAALLERQGDFSQAGDLVRHAAATAADPQTTTGWASRLEHRAAAAADDQHQLRIDRMAESLRSQRPDVNLPESQSEWRSRPLTVWLMDMETVGYDLREGGAALLSSSIVDRLVTEKRFQVVEQELVNRLKADLKPGPFDPADPESVRSLGHLAGVRLIVAGRLVHSAPNTEVTLRCIEAKTGQITAVVNHMFDIQAAVSVMADRTADELIEKLKDGYPLRASVLEKHGTKLFLDIGRSRGAVMGATLKALENDLTAKVINVDSEKCVAEILTGIDAVEIGLRLEQVH